MTNKRDIRFGILHDNLIDMEFEKQQHELKSGHQVVIRKPRIEESKHVLDLKRSYIKNTRTIAMDLAEYPNDVEREKMLINKLVTSTNSLMLVAELNGTLVGNIDLNGNQRRKMHHTAMLGMGIDTNWRNQGLGKILITCALDWAKSNSPLKIVWLDVYATNDLGYHLYKNMGFEECGRIKGFFKSEEGYIDKIQMSIKLK